MSIFNKKRDEDTDDGIVVIKRTQPCTCGGTDAYIDTKAPKEIASEEMTLFDVTSAFRTLVIDDSERLDYVSAFAARVGGGSFVFLETRWYSDYNEPHCEWALLKEDIMPKLTALAREHGLAKNNGYHSQTHGLPEDFGGSVDIRYASGERISISDNQSPVIPYDFGVATAEAFAEALKGERAALPDLSALTAIRYAEEREDGGFTRATLTINPDGTGTNAKTSRYDDPTVYESEKPVDAETVAAIRSSIERCGMLAWADLPESDYKSGPEKTLAFVFADGGVITVPGGKRLPDQLGGGFFNIELEMTTKH